MERVEKTRKGTSLSESIQRARLYLSMYVRLWCFSSET